MCDVTQLSVDPTALKLHLLRLQARVHERTASSDRDSIDFVYSCARQISEIRGRRFIDIRFECAERLVPYFYASARLDHALEAACLMRDLGQLSARRDWIRRAHTFIGVIHGELGNVSSAILEYHEALRLAEELGDRRGAAGTFLNLGNAFLYGGLFNDAKACFRQTLNISEGSAWDKDLVAGAFANLAQAHFYSGEIQEAYDMACRALNPQFMPGTLKELHSKTIHELTFVRIAVMMGKITEAAEHAERCSIYAHRAGGSQSLIHSKLARGMVECFAGNATIGLRMLQECLEAAASFGVVARIASLEILARGCQACRRSDLALQYIQEVLSSVRAHRESELQALMSLNVELAKRRMGDERDLQALTTAEATMRAAAAELELANVQYDMLERLAITATLKDDSSGVHGYRVGCLSALLAKELGWAADRCYELETAARLHDIGKVAIPDSIALSDRAFEPAQRQIMRSHTTVGAELLSNHTGSTVRLAAEVARYHHEWWDGTGYPGGLAGNRIPMSCRIVALADVFDALTHGRRYAPAFSCEDALVEIEASSGRQFDPDLVPVFRSLVRGLAIQHTSLDEFLGRSARSSAFFAARRKIEAIVSRNISPPQTGAVG